MHTAMNALLILGLLALAAAPARADISFTVTTTLDRVDDNPGNGSCHTVANACSLRAAIMEANRTLAPGTARIVVPAGTYLLSRPINGANGDDSGDLNLTQPNLAGQWIMIAGAGAGSTIIDGGQLDRVIHVASNRGAILSDLTLRNGLASGDGGGVLSEGGLNIRRSRIEGNRSGQSGGGVRSHQEFYLFDSVVSGNTAANDGGGLYGSGAVEVRGSTIGGNAALGLGNGGGAYLTASSTIIASTIHGNSANNGGGLLAESRMTLLNCTVSTNAARGNGGGVYNFGLTHLLNTSVIDNDADHDRDENGGIGGGVYAAAGEDRHLLVTNALIARNTLFDSPIYNDCSGLLEAYGRNFFYDLDGCNIPNPGSGLVTLATIGPLQDNGGPTFTHALLAGSEAIDASASNFGCVDDGGEPLEVDQRSAGRPVGVRCDVGAFEFGGRIERFKNGFE